MQGDKRSCLGVRLLVQQDWEIFGPLSWKGRRIMSSQARLDGYFHFLSCSLKQQDVVRLPSNDYFKISLTQCIVLIIDVVK